MTEIEKAIQAFEIALEGPVAEAGTINFYAIIEPAAREALAALRAQLAGQQNAPLTLEELRGMLHRPVYDGLGYDWYIVDEVDDDGITMTDGTRFDVDNGYDAVSNRFYRRPPEE